MKKLFFTALVLLSTLSGIAQKSKYMTFQGEIANKNGDAVYITDGKNKLIKKIQVTSEGTFKDTLHVAHGRYSLSDGNEFTIVYLKNGFDLKLKMDTKKFDESIIYSGKGALENNFLAKNSLFEEQTDMGSLLAASEVDFLKGLDKKKLEDLKRLQNTKLDPIFIDLQKKSIDENYNGVVKYYKMNYEANLAKSKLANTMSPSFNYDNYAGGKTKLEDFKGKYVYIDVWATWCGPCRAEIPFLKKNEEKYHGKNISFVSISVDVQKDIEKWKTLIKDKELGGVQLFADNNWNSQFIKDYGINSIPRFILIDPTGKIVSADASRPSSAELQVQLDALLN
ncbi:TlpA family protein disulfide reductase [Flavobacterium sp. ZS1P70]|uniref:TlpA family protein disulfide reductase n=1 Tax=Flavobacterium zhoui TaxID=3230414 RepID=A0ABW6I505_9FLAO